MTEFAVVLGLLIIDWPWRDRRVKVVAPLLRGALVSLAAFWLLGALDTGHARRIATATDDRVTTIQSRTLDAYVSGVYTMDREVSEQVRDALFPILVLGWLGLVPAIRGFRLALREGYPRGPQDAVK